MPDDPDVKSAFDARKSYSSVVELALREEKALANMGDMYRWARSLRTLLSLVIAYMPREKADLIDKRLQAAQNLAATMGGNRKVQQSLHTQLDQDLRDIEYDIHRHSASFMWPTMATDEGEFNEKDFREGSDL